MATIYIDGKPYPTDENQNLLHVCLGLGFNLPYFCWHPALGSVGACRQCAVKQFKDENDEQGKLVMACMVPAKDGTRISIRDAEAREFRAAVIEWLMVHHPHDCPVCDEGGECHLQDMTEMTGHAYREVEFPKRTYHNQYLGPFINHEMNRCIQCYRCVRFYREYAGGRDFDVFAAHDNVYFGRHEEGTLENEFSGNLVEVCPTGVFTDKTLKQHYTRKWDLQTAPSVCAHCAAGCNTLAADRGGSVRRILNRYHGQVNGYFLCDRGRFGYGYINSGFRIRGPFVRPSKGDEASPADAVPADAGEALGRVVEVLRTRLGPAVGDGSSAAEGAPAARAIGIGSPRASLESNFALRKLVGPQRFYQGISRSESELVQAAIRVLQTGPARSPSIKDIELCDAVLVLGEDVTNTAPRVALALRQSVRQEPIRRHLEGRPIALWQDAAVRDIVQGERGPMFLAAPCPTRLDDVATEARRLAPDDIARLGFAVAHALDERAPQVDELGPEEQAAAGRIAEALKKAERPLVVCGTGCGSLSVIQAAANAAWALCAAGKRAELSFALPECNSLGLGLLGGGALDEAAEAVRRGEADTVVILENDLYRRESAATVDRLLDAARHVIVLDSLANGTTEKADVVLPAATVAESTGTLVNSEGRAQQFYRVLPPAGDVRDSWRWLYRIGHSAGVQDLEDAGKVNHDRVVWDLSIADPVFRPLAGLAPPAGYRIHGEKIPRQPHRYSGRTASSAHKNVHEPKPPDDPDSPLAHSMEGYQGQPPPELITRYWAPGWNSVQALNKFQGEIAGPVPGGDPGERLIEPAGPAEPEYFSAIPARFTPRPDNWLVVPVHHIFGSEELSVHSPGIAQRSPGPYLALNPDDAAALQVPDGRPVRVASNGLDVRLPVKTLSALPRGVAGIPRGLPDVPAAGIGPWIDIEPEQ